MEDFEEYRVDYIGPDGELYTEYFSSADKQLEWVENNIDVATSRVARLAQPVDGYKSAQVSCTDGWLDKLLNTYEVCYVGPESLIRKQFQSAEEQALFLDQNPDIVIMYIY